MNSVFNAHRDPFGFLSDLFKKDQKGNSSEATVSGQQASIAVSIASTQSIIETRRISLKPCETPRTITVWGFYCGGFRTLVLNIWLI